MQANSFPVARKIMPSGALINSAPRFALGTSKDFPTTVDNRWGGAVPLLQSEVQQRHWMPPDGRDAFISWLRAEFAAANAIIDALCHHLQLTGKPGEYDFVLACIQQRRCNWNAVLHMQQYFSIAEVIFALQQVMLRKQQMQSFDRSNLYLSQVSVVPDERNAIQKANTLKATSQGSAPITLNPSPQNSTVNSVESHRDQLRDDESKKGNRFACQPTNRSNENRQEASHASELTSVSVNAQDSPAGAAMEDVDSLLETELPVTSDIPNPLERHQCEVAYSNSSAKQDFGQESKTQPLGRFEGAVSSEINTADAMETRNESNVIDEAHILRVNATDKEIIPLQQIPATSNTKKQTGSLSRSINGDHKFSKSEEESQIETLKITKNFSCFEQIDGKMINVVEGLELYENFLDKTKSSQLLSSLYELECVARKGRLGGYRFVASKKWTKAKGRKNIQFGSLEYAEDDERYQSNTDDAIEPMPIFLQETIDNLIHQKIVLASKKPDCCNLIVLDEGEYLSPHSMHYDLEKPPYILTLACDCIAILGRTLKMDAPGEFVSSFKIILSVGSVLVLQGHSSDIARLAISSSPAKRVLLLFGKLKPKKGSRVFMQAPGAPSSILSSVTIPFPNPASSTSQIGNFKASGQIPSPATLISRNYTSVSVPTVNRPPPPHAAAQFPPPIISSSTVQSGTYPSMTITNPVWTAVPGPVRVHATGTGVFLPSSGVPSSVIQPINGSMPAQIRQVFMPVPPLQKTTSSPAALSSLDNPEPVISSRPAKAKARNTDGVSENSGRSSVKKDFGKGSTDGKARSDAANGRLGDVKQQAALDGHSGPVNVT